MTNGRPSLGALKRTPRGVRFNAAELTIIRDRATAAGLTLNSFIRRAALGALIVTPVPELNRQAWADLARVTGNLNQIIRAMHGGSVAAARLLPSTVSQLADQVRALRLSLIGETEEADS